MIDQSSQFYAILTNIGVAKQANADALGIAWKITQLGVGDANGTDPQPSATQKTLINEWRRAPLNQLKQDAANPAIIIAEQVIPADVGGKWIREIGLYDADGDLVAVANCAPSFKPLLSQGSGRTQVVRMNLIVSNSANVELKIDPSVVLATREFVLSELAKMDFKNSVMVCAPGSILLSGLQTIDGVAVPANKRVLAPFQTAAKDRGIWVTAAGAWTRATDADTSDEVTPGMLVAVEQGTFYGDSAWQLITDAPVTLGVTPLTFEMAWGRTGVTAGDYRSVTVDKYGRVVAASNPTTVAGYGLTDVYTKTQLDTALGLKANLANPVLTGVPKAPTAAASTNTDQIATTAFVQALFTALVGAAPETLDQINEIAAALGNDPNFSTTIMNALALRAPIASPVLKGNPQAPTPALGDNDTSIATTAFVQAALRSFGIGATDSTANNTLDLDKAVWGSFIKTEGVEADAAIYNRPVTGAAGAAAVCFDVLTFGLLGRTTQYATQLFAAGGRGRTWVRVQHDAIWYPWRELVMTDSPTLIGDPRAPTPPVGDNNTSIATTAFVQTALAVFGVGAVNGPRVTDLDALRQGGMYFATSQALGLPIAANSSLLHVPYSDNSAALQLCCTLSPPTRIYYRTRSSGMWNGWKEFSALDSPVFTGDPRAPTAPVGDNDTSIANTAFVQAALAAFGIGTPISLAVADLDNLVLGGFYRASPGTKNAPAPANMSVLVSPYNSGGCLQIASVLSGTTSAAKLYFRTQAAGNWSAWKELVTTESPALSGNPTAPTAEPGDSSSTIATTGFVRSAVGNMVGMVAHFAMAAPPDGWLKRNGAAVSRTTYAALFRKIGTLYGAGDGSTTFNLPDSRGHFDRGWDDGRNIDTGRVLGSGQGSQNLLHDHTATTDISGSHTHTTIISLDRGPGGDGNALYGDENYYGTTAQTTGAGGAHKHVVTVAASGGSEARPINTAFLPCIKY